MPPCSCTICPRSRKISLSSWMPFSISSISASRSAISDSWNSSSDCVIPFERCTCACAWSCCPSPPSSSSRGSTGISGVASWSSALYIDTHACQPLQKRARQCWARLTPDSPIALHPSPLPLAQDSSLAPPGPCRKTAAAAVDALAARSSPPPCARARPPPCCAPCSAAARPGTRSARPRARAAAWPASSCAATARCRRERRRRRCRRAGVRAWRAPSGPPRST